jgi:hypothetical protein
MTMMPPLISAESACSRGSRRLFICAEGFEPRALEWVTRESHSVAFERSLILRYKPRKPESLYRKLLHRVRRATVSGGVEPHEFHRFEPVLFEWNFYPRLIAALEGIDCVVIDISVMSKLMILMLLVMLKGYSRSVRIIYSEPENYAPSQEEYQIHREQWSQFYAQPTFGVHCDVVQRNDAKVSDSASSICVV